MKFSRPSSVEEIQVIGQFESLREVLLGDEHAEHLDKPLAYWALPGDRRLPLALLGRTLRELLNTPFATLAATPGVGQKKLTAFVALLARVANTDPAALPAVESVDSVASDDDEPHDGFDPATVSAIVWDQWRTSVVRHGLGGEKLGRLTSSLRQMTRVIWNRTLGEYAGQSLPTIRALKTHGEKRVRAVLEVFYSVHALVAQMGSPRHLTVRIVPRAIDQVEQWINRVLQHQHVPGDEEVNENYVDPLLGQIRIDANEQIVQLAETRLGLHGPITSVRQVARGMGLTRARVYQLLNEINDILLVRWPDGRHLSYALAERLQAEATDGQATQRSRFQAALELFYPCTRRSATDTELAEDEADEEILVAAH